MSMARSPIPGRSRPRGPAIRRLRAATASSVWSGCGTRGNTTGPQCPTRSSSMGAMRFTGPIRSASSAARRATAACACIRPTPASSTSSFAPTAERPSSSQARRTTARGAAGCQCVLLRPNRSGIAVLRAAALLWLVPFLRPRGLLSASARRGRQAQARPADAVRPAGPARCRRAFPNGCERRHRAAKTRQASGLGKPGCS